MPDKRSSGKPMIWSEAPLGLLVDAPMAGDCSASFPRGDVTAVL
jgi:hypothetical protein